MRFNPNFIEEQVAILWLCNLPIVVKVFNSFIDVVLWNAHPLSVYASPDFTFIDGELFFSKERDVQLRAERAAERAELEKAEPNMAPSGRGGAGGRGAAGATPATPSSGSR